MFPPDSNAAGSQGRGLHHERYGSQTLIRGMPVTEDQVEAMIDEFAKADDYQAKTWSRRVVESFLMNYRWYFPRKYKKNAPSLSKAWAYYEHITLPRHFTGEQTADHVLRRAEPGEAEETDLYHPLRTPSSSFIEWGIGVDLYFSSLRMMAVVMLVAGLMNLPNIIFYASNDYSPQQKDGLSFSLKTSAVCTSFEWVVCEDCTKSQWESNEQQNSFGTTEIDGSTTTFVLRNDCDGGDFKHGIVNWATLLFLFFVTAALSIYLRAREVRFDEDKLTSTDYSIVVKNPPPEAYDPDEWRDFFAQFADKQVTAVTVALDNDTLLRKLIARRIHRNNLRRMLPKGTDLDDEDLVRSAVAQLVLEMESEPKGCILRLLKCTVFPALNLINMLLPPQTLVDKTFKLTEEIKELEKEKYNVSTVFVTFETEEGQRAALAALSVSKVDIMISSKANSAPSAIFHDRVLKVEEPTEPSAVRWLDLSASSFRKILIRVINLAITLSMVFVAGYFVNQTRENLGPALSGPLISIFNAIIPQIVKLLMLFERHTTEGSYQVSLYMKITLFRWANTAVLIQVITPFTSTVSDGDQDVLRSIHSILWSELLLVPGLRLLDLYGNFKKHIMAPRAINQAEMNHHFQGTFYNLGERYTDLTKVLFVCFFYSALFPLSFWFGAAILIVQYYTDKYCLMRIWAWTPLIGAELAKFSRRYFFSGAILAFAIVSSYAWAQFPYDNVCDPNTPSATDYTGVYQNVKLLSENIVSITVNQPTSVIFCSQNWRDSSGIFFPPTSRIQPDGATWMSDSQESLTDLYGITALVVLVAFVLFFFGGTLTRVFLSLFRGTYEPDGQNQQVDFSSVSEIFGYVPQIKLKAFPFPFLACNIDQIDQGLVGWNDPANSYDFWNVSMDVEYEGMPRKKMMVGNTRNTGKIGEQEEFTEVDTSLRKFPIFAVIKHWPPAWQLAKAAKDKSK